jgi:hypothetical protein
MVKMHSLESKRDILAKLVQQIRDAGKGPIIPIMKLLIKIVKEQKERQSVSSYSSSYTSQTPTASYSHTTPSGSVITSYSYKSAEPEESIYNTNTQASTPTADEEPEKLTLNKVLMELNSEGKLVQTVLENLRAYCTAVREAGIEASADRKKIHVYSKSYSHAEEIEERLSFLKLYASQCDFEFKKVELRVIYDSLSVQSPVKADQAEFLTWCKLACQQSAVLNLNEMGEYFSELMQQNEMDVETLPVVGFDFLQNYFLSMNEQQSNLLINHQSKEKKPKQQSTAGVSWNSYFVGVGNYTPVVEIEESEDDEPEFNVVIHPSKLEKLDLIWIVVKKATDPVVVRKATDFLIKVYTKLDEALSDKRCEIA